MLVRTYRITDRLGIVFLKLITGFTEIILDNIAALRYILQRNLAILLRLLIALVSTILGALGFVGTRLGGRQAGRNARAGSRRGDTSGSSVMARRSEAARVRGEIDTGIVEDPLKRQNRLLSAMFLIALGALVAIVIWATSNSGSNRAFTPSSQDLGIAANPTNPPVSNVDTEINLDLPTAVPTATNIPAVLQARGTVAYTVREDGQTDIWATPIDSLTPIRLTNSPADERDPAWSPDGTKLAYASNKNGNWDIYIYDVTTDEDTQMTFSLAFEAGPAWSPNGEFLVYESYQEDTHIDIYIMRVDGTPISTPRVPQSSNTADYSPVWSPDGSRMAFVSTRDDNQDIYIFTIADSSLYNLTNTPDRDEDFPAWSPDGRTLAFSGVENGIELVFTQPVDAPTIPAQVFRQGRTPAWSPNGNSIIFATDVGTGTLFTVAPFVEGTTATEAFAVLTRGAYHPTWTATPLPAALVNSGGRPEAVPEPLFIEAQREPSGDPPYGLRSLPGVDGAEQPVLSERVDDSFNALRRAVNEAVGRDFLGRLTDVFWDINYRPPGGEEIRNWHKTGRAVAFNRNRIVGFPPEVEIVREDTDLTTRWRVFVRVVDEAQDGQLGEPMRRIPWDFERDTVESYDRGGRLKAQVPYGYYVDLTQIAADYGWQPMPAGADWRDNFSARNYWIFYKRDGLNWYDAMREIYTVGELGGFNPTPTPAANVDVPSDS